MHFLNIVSENKLTNTIQKRLKVSSTQLLYQSSLYQAAVLFATGPLVDRMLTNRSVSAFNYTFEVLVSAFAPHTPISGVI